MGEVFVGVLAALLVRDVLRSMLADLPHAVHRRNIGGRYRLWTQSVRFARAFGVERR
jgi:hypothetical protein